MGNYLDNKKVTLLLGTFMFEEEPLKCTIVSLEHSVQLDISIADVVGDALISDNVFDSYLIPELYYGEINFIKI